MTAEAAAAETEAPQKINADLEKKTAALAKQLKDVRENVHKVIIGQEQVVNLCLTAILSGGHFLIMGLPGLGKTKLVDTLGVVLGLDARRVQCTPDLMPADILGSEILSEKDGDKVFKFIHGPIFSQLLMADEINRASPRTQSALLQAMQEYQVSVGGTTYDLPRPFHVMATQNPLEQEGTYPLPEAQLDRFMLQVNIGYPTPEEERKMVLVTTGTHEDKADKVMSAEDVMEAQRIIRQLPVGQKVLDGILKLVQAGRPDQSPLDSVKKHVSWGPGPRAAQAFMLAARAKAILENRYSPSLDDVLALAPSVLRHRMELHFSARAEGRTVENIIAEMCEVLD
ncbi:MAG: AAA domain-containing protein [Alphaproteobacteria bacterium]|nr:AAA domain-containing protein [Alphaproteobacteria bacterium]